MHGNNYTPISHVIYLLEDEARFARVNFTCKLAAGKPLFFWQWIFFFRNCFQFCSAVSVLQVQVCPHILSVFVFTHCWLACTKRCIVSPVPFASITYFHPPSWYVFPFIYHSSIYCLWGFFLFIYHSLFQSLTLSIILVFIVFLGLHYWSTAALCSLWVSPLDRYAYLHQ